MGELAERSGFQAEGQAGIRGGMSAAVLWRHSLGRRRSLAGSKSRCSQDAGKSLFRMIRNNHALPMEWLLESVISRLQ